MYGVHDAQLMPVQKGYRNESYAALLPGGEAVNLMLYKREPGMLTTLRRANHVGDYLAAQGFPARSTRYPRILRIRTAAVDDVREKRNRTCFSQLQAVAPVDARRHVQPRCSFATPTLRKTCVIPPGRLARYAALYNYLSGSTIPWDSYTMEHLKQLGAVMSGMHHLLEVAPFTLENRVTDEYTVIATRMRSYFAEPGVRGALDAKLGLQVAVPERFFVLLRGCAGLSSQQILHMDFVRGNILFGHDAHITGVLDFEKAARGHPLFDIARTLAFLLVDCKYKTPAQVRKYFLISGYNKRGAGSFKVTARNTPLLEQLVDLFLLYDFYKFLRHNPYESLPQNEHFVRTRALLLGRQLVAETAKNGHTIT